MIHPWRCAQGHENLTELGDWVHLVGHKLPEYFWGRTGVRPGSDPGLTARRVM